MAGFLGEIQKVFVDDAAHAVHGTVDVLHLLESPCLQRHANQRLVDDGSRAATLGYKNFFRRHADSFSALVDAISIPAEEDIVRLRVPIVLVKTSGPHEQRLQRVWPKLATPVAMHRGVKHRALGQHIG